MNKVRLYHLLLAIVLGTIAGRPVQLQADDTEIYLGNTNVATGVRPNVLFILDTSGSMARCRWIFKCIGKKDPRNMGTDLFSVGL